MKPSHEPLADIERRVLEAARLAAAPGATRADWETFCSNHSADIFAVIDRGASTESVRAFLTALADLCHAAPEASERLWYLIGRIHREEMFRNSDREPVRPNFQLAQVSPPGTERMLDQLRETEERYFNEGQQGY